MFDYVFRRRAKLVNQYDSNTGSPEIGMFFEPAFQTLTGVQATLGGIQKHRLQHERHLKATWAARSHTTICRAVNNDEGQIIVSAVVDRRPKPYDVYGKLCIRSKFPTKPKEVATRIKVKGRRVTVRRDPRFADHDTRPNYREAQLDPEGTGRVQHIKPWDGVNPNAGFLRDRPVRSAQ